MRKLICELLLVPVSFPGNVEVYLRPAEFTGEEWKPGVPRAWAELRRDLEEKGHDLTGVEERLESGEEVVTDKAFHYWR